MGGVALVPGVVPGSWRGGLQPLGEYLVLTLVGSLSRFRGELWPVEGCGGTLAPG